MTTQPPWLLIAIVAVFRVRPDWAAWLIGGVVSAGVRLWIWGTW